MTQERGLHCIFFLDSELRLQKEIVVPSCLDKNLPLIII